MNKKVGSESAIEGGDEKLEREHRLLGIKDGDNLFQRSPLYFCRHKTNLTFCLGSVSRHLRALLGKQLHFQLQKYSVAVCSYCCVTLDLIGRFEL